MGAANAAKVANASKSTKATIAAYANASRANAAIISGILRTIAAFVEQWFCLHARV